MISICTNRPLDFCKQVLDQLELTPLFDDIIGGDVGFERKPSADMLEETLQRLNIDRRQAALVGDSTVDIEAAHRAGMSSISVSWGYSATEKLLKAKPSHLIHHMNELLDLYPHSVTE